MKTATGRRSISSFNLSILFGVLAVAVLAGPFYSVDSSSRGGGAEQNDKLKAGHPGAAKTLLRSGLAATRSRPTIVGETVEVFAADCSTPKAAFNLGETVCARTDGVDLSVPGNHYMNWIDSQLNSTNGGTITQNPQYFLFSPPTADTWKATIGRVTPPDSSIIGNPPLFTVSADRPGIGIFTDDGAGGCSNTPKSVFNLQDTDKDVCARVTGGQANQYILWSNAEFELVQNVPLGSSENVFTLSAGSSLGDWRVILFEPFGGSVYALTPFTVTDAANPSADVTITKGSASSSVAAGSQAVFTVQVTNLGPDDASGLQITDSIPLNTTFSSFAQVSGPSGTNCVLPSAGASSGDSICTIPTLARGETATFLAAYDVLSGVQSDTLISNTVSADSTTPDPNGNNDSSTAAIPVLGVTAETCTLDCPANVVVTENTTQGGQPGAVVTFGAASPEGNCGAVTNNPASGTFFTVGTHSIISSSELGGATCSFTVTVLATSPPTISCPANITVNLQQGETEATGVNPGTPTINASGGGTVTFLRSDDDDDPSTPQKPLTDPYPIGSTGILWTVTDAGGRTASCTQTITVVAAGDRDPVTISCPANVTVTAPSGSCEATISAATIGTPTTTPSDGNVQVVGVRSDDQPLTDPYPAGTTQITWTATDNLNGNVASCVQNITVIGNDTEDPVLTIPGNLSVTSSSCTVIRDDELGVATATDNCTPSVNVSRTGVPANFVFPTGTTVITYTATDAAGNSASAIQLVTVTESPAVNPTITAPADLTGANAVNTGPAATSCGAFIGDATLGSATANDNCPGVVVTRTGVPAGNIFPVGNTIITYRATDKSGNFAEDTQTVTVVDNTVPVVTPPGPVTLYTGPGATACNVTVTDLDGTFGTGSATDNCPGVGAVSRSGVPSGNIFPVGMTTLTYSATDAHGNTGSATQTVTVIDNTTPTISCPADITQGNDPGQCGAVIIYTTPVGSDNCAGATTVQTAGLPSGSSFPVGTTTNTFQVTDAVGNMASCSFTVTVNDVENPVISCPSNQTLEPTCPSGAIATYATPTATDNCAVQSVVRTAGGASGSVFPIGTTTVTHLATDIHGNTASCSFTVTVKTVLQTIDDLRASVAANTQLNGPQRNGLLSKLDAAKQHIQNGQQNGACAKLADFINSVQNFINQGNLSAATGNAWISTANNIRNAIGCTSNPCT